MIISNYCTKRDARFDRVKEATNVRMKQIPILLR